MRYAYELFVAWRYLRDRAARTGYTVLLVGLCMMAVAALFFVLAAVTDPLRPSELLDGKTNWKLLSAKAGLGFLVPGILVAVFGALRTMQSIFTTISTVGVWWGTMAMVIVLSVMNGFEVDLRQKILGSNAHVLIS